MDLVAPGGKAARKFGHERLRATLLRISDLADQRSEDRYLHPAITL
jgi:hypothetical protein